MAFSSIEEKNYICNKPVHMIYEKAEYRGLQFFQYEGHPPGC